MKLIMITGLVCLGSLAAQDVHHDYDRSTNFAAYRSYQWVDAPAGPSANQITDGNIKRAVDEQLALKGLRRVDSSWRSS